MARLNAAMNLAASDALGDMYEETEGFYSGSSPSMYVRTGALGDTPEVSGVSSSGTSASFTARLNQDSGYTTGDSPSMSQVLALANSGAAWTTASGAPARDTVGRKGFWERAEKKIEKDFHKRLAQFFG